MKTFVRFSLLQFVVLLLVAATSGYAAPPSAVENGVGAGLQPSALPANWETLRDEPQRSFKEAHSSYLYGEQAQAANNLSRGLAVLDDLVQRSRQQETAAIREAVTVLKGLHTGLAGGKIYSKKQLEPQFQKTMQALARFYLSAARSAFDRNEAALSGHYLELSVLRLQDFYSWGQRSIDVAAGNAIKTAHELSYRLRQGEAADPVAVRAALTDLRAYIDS